MKRLWITLFVVLVTASFGHCQYDDENDYFPDEDSWRDEDNYDSEVGDTHGNTDEKVDAEIQLELETDGDANGKSNENNIGELQPTDDLNGQLVEENEVVAINKEPGNDEPLHDYQIEDNRSGLKTELDIHNSESSVLSDENDFEDGEDKIASEKIEFASNENASVYNEPADDTNDFADIQSNKNTDNADAAIVKETEAILEKDDSTIDDSNKEANVQSNNDETDANASEEQAYYDSAEYGDDVQKAFSDLQEDLGQLAETWVKLNEDSNAEDIPQNEDKTAQDVNDYEEKFGRPIGENYILSVRDQDYWDYETVHEDDSENIHGNNSTDGINDNQKLNAEIEDENDKVNENDQFDGESSNAQQLKETVMEEPKHAVEEEHVAKHEIIQKEKNPDRELTITELTHEMIKFADDHEDDLDIESENFDKHIAPIYITLTSDEPTIITSPNYPDTYPTNNIVDWIFDADNYDAMGIEMNITDFHVNGNVGDYLLVKPGGLDETSTGGLVFSYNLNTESPVKYRFLDVNKVFVRFESKPNAEGYKGFQFSIKVIEPVSKQPTTDEPPVTSPVVQPPHSHLVFLGGMNQVEFRNISEEFRLLIADMATFYVNRNGLEVGDVPTVEVTQIVNTAACHLSWPGFENCTAVRFGVPLALSEDAEYALDEKQLEDMWKSSVDEDPFAARLSRMGVKEFLVPSDRRALVTWVMLGGVACVVAVLLALASWRYTCFQDYSRMPAASDTDSIVSDMKRRLDLYPTPHQDLPPLYDEEFSKGGDTTRVDMGGYTNKSYARELFDFDSDEDSAHDNKSPSEIRPSDIYKV